MTTAEDFEVVPAVEVRDGEPRYWLKAWEVQAPRWTEIEACLHIKEAWPDADRAIVRRRAPLSALHPLGLAVRCDRSTCTAFVSVSHSVTDAEFAAVLKALRWTTSEGGTHHWCAGCGTGGGAP